MQLVFIAVLGMQVRIPSCFKWIGLKPVKQGVPIFNGIKSDEQLIGCGLAFGSIQF